MKKPARTFIVDKRDALGTTLLMEAARQGTLDRLLQCLDEGSNLNAVDGAGNNALMYAIEGRHDAVATLLLQRGINAERKNTAGRTPLIAACDATIPEIVQRLLEKKVALDVQDKLGNTALMMSCLRGDGWAACKLVEAGADFETLTNSKGATALTLARAGLRSQDLPMFLQCIDKRREQQRNAAAAAAAAKEEELAQNVRNATVLQRNVTPLKPVAFRPKAP